jgi:Ca2+-transporting ATPase
MEDGKTVAFMKGAPEVVLERCSFLLDGDERRALSDADRTRILRANEEMAERALRVLGVAYRELPERDGYGEDLVEAELTFLGLVGMMDPPREEAIEAVRVCRQVHIKPVMITGDHRLTAVAVAKELAIHRDGDLVLTGEELANLGDDEFEGIVERVTVYARVSPMDKLKIITAWKKKGEVVAMTGDGVNDAPALKHADIGIAMGITGTEVAKEASDIVLGDDNFATIVRAIERGRWIYDNIKKYLTYLLRANLTEVLILGGVVVAMGPEYLPLLPAAILYINLATDGLPALALGIAPADPDIMERPPRDPQESVFSKDVRTLVLLGVVIECPIFLWMFFRHIGDLQLARTQMFFLFVVIELIVAINFRSLRYSLVKAPPHRWLLLAIGWELLLIGIVVQIPAVREAFGITVPRFPDLALIAGLGVFVMIAIEIAKLVMRARASGSSRGFRLTGRH